MDEIQELRLKVVLTAILFEVYAVAQLLDYEMVLFQGNLVFKENIELRKKVNLLNQENMALHNKVL